MVETSKRRWFFLILFAFAFSCNGQAPSAETGDTDTDTETGQENHPVGFETGEEKSGKVPGNPLPDEAPQIVSASIDPEQVEEGDPLWVTLTFEDKEGDVAVVSFGVEGEDTYNELAVDDAAGATYGSLLMEIYPKDHVPGFYTLNLSVTDAEGNVSNLVGLDFTLLNPDGTVPEGGGDTDEDTEDDTGEDTGDNTGNDTGNDTGEDTGIDTGPPEGPTFLMGFIGNGTPESPPAIVAVTAFEGEPYIQTISEVGPRFLSGNLLDYTDQRIAFFASPEFFVDGRGPIARIELDSPEEVKWVPIPESDDSDYAFEVPETRPQLLTDGRVVAQVSYVTVDDSDYFDERQLALWDPETDELVLQGGLSSLLLSQPEVEACNPDCDLEWGAADGTFALSPDDRHVYLHLVGMGESSDTGLRHTQESYLARWDLETGETEILEYLGTRATVLAVTGDNRFVVLDHEGMWKKYDIDGDLLETFSDVSSYVEAGQVSAAGPELVDGWSDCGGDFGGVTLWDLAAGASLRIIDAGLYDDFHKGIGDKAQINPDATTVYFTAAAEECVNYQSEIVVMRSPVQENNPEPDILMTLDSRYDNGLFILLDE